MDTNILKESVLQMRKDLADSIKNIAGINADIALSERMGSDIKELLYRKYKEVQFINSLKDNIEAVEAAIVDADPLYISKDEREAVVKQFHFALGKDSTYFNGVLPEHVKVVPDITIRNSTFKYGGKEVKLSEIPDDTKVLIRIKRNSWEKDKVAYATSLRIVGE